MTTVSRFAIFATRSGKRFHRIPERRGPEGLGPLNPSVQPRSSPERPSKSSPAKPKTQPKLPLASAGTGNAVLLGLRRPNDREKRGEEERPAFTPASASTSRVQQRLSCLAARSIASAPVANKAAAGPSRGKTMNPDRTIPRSGRGIRDRRLCVGHARRRVAANPG